MVVAPSTPWWEDSHAVVTTSITTTTYSSKPGVTILSADPLSSLSLAPVTSSTVSHVVCVSTHDIVHYYMQAPHLHLPSAQHISFSQQFPVLIT